MLTLALGIGANTAIFRLVDTILLRSLPVDRPGELLAIRGTFSYFRFEQLRDRNDVFSAVFGARALGKVTISADGQPLGQPTTELVSGNYFSLLGVRPILGRAIAPDDDRAVGAGPVAVISYGLWQRAFAGSPAVLGRTLRLRDGSIGGGTSGFEPAAPNAPPPPDETVLTDHRRRAGGLFRRHGRHARGRVGPDHDAAHADAGPRLDHAAHGVVGQHHGPSSPGHRRRARPRIAGQDLAADSPGRDRPGDHRTAEAQPREARG